MPNPPDAQDADAGAVARRPRQDRGSVQLAPAPIDPGRTLLNPICGHSYAKHTRAAKTSLFCDDRCSITANPGDMISEKDARVVSMRYGERREHRPVADFQLLKNVMQVHLDGAIGNIQPAPNFLI